MKSPHELKFVFHTWEIRVSHADAKPTPMETPVTLLTWENRTGSLSRPGWRMLGLELPFTYCYGQRHSRQLCPPQMTAENCTDKTHSETHQLRDHLRGGERKLQFITRATRTGNPPRTPTELTTGPANLDISLISLLKPTGTNMRMRLGKKKRVDEEEEEGELSAPWCWSSMLHASLRHTGNRRSLPSGVWTQASG